MAPLGAILAYARDRGFESCSLQRGVSCEPELTLPEPRHRPQRRSRITGGASLAGNSILMPSYFANPQLPY